MKCLILHYKYIIISVVGSKATALGCGIKSLPEGGVTNTAGGGVNEKDVIKYRFSANTVYALGTIEQPDYLFYFCI